MSTDGRKRRRKSRSKRKGIVDRGTRENVTIIATTVASGFCEVEELRSESVQEEQLTGNMRERAKSQAKKDCNAMQWRSLHLLDRQLDCVAHKIVANRDDCSQGLSLTGPSVIGTIAYRAFRS